MNTRGRPMPVPLPRQGSVADRIFTVSEITRGIRNVIEDAFGPVTVQGEILGYKGTHASSGHTYFDIKDANAKIGVVIYSDRATPAMLAGLQNGISVQIYGEVTVYEKDGKNQIKAYRVEPVGYGALQAKFDALKRKLQEEGLFAPERKRLLPRYPTRIGIVTSDAGAALQDMVRLLRERAPYARLVFESTRVQGEAAAREIASALDRLNQRDEVDVIIVGRGGGSPLDLWAFNEEVVVRAIVRSRIPVISAVGHETDQPLSDHAADVRAATPSHAAQLVVKEIAEIRRTLDSMSSAARKRIQAELAHARSRLEGFERHRAMKEPAWKIREYAQQVDRFEERLRQALRDWVTKRREMVSRCDARLQAHAPARSLAHARDRVEACHRSLIQAANTGLSRRRDRLESLERLLRSFDHHNVLERGYALVWSEGNKKLHRSGLDLRPGDPIEVQFFDARAGAKVLEVRKETS